MPNVFHDPAQFADQIAAGERMEGNTHILTALFLPGFVLAVPKTRI